MPALSARPVHRVVLCSAVVLSCAACTDDGGSAPASSGCAARCAEGDRVCLLERCGPYAIDEDGDHTALAEDCDDRDPARHRAAPEACDGVDNDCDRVVDEGCACVDGQRRECGFAIGACAQGTQACAGGRWGACDGVVTPRPEGCGDGVDDDCDGSIDNGCPCEASSAGAGTSLAGALVPAEAAARCGLRDGACRPGVQLCRDGVLSACIGSVGPTAELCDGTDNDCDGSIDEECPCAPGSDRTCGAGDGECQPGTQGCNDGRFGGCEGRVGPQPEACDERDNDCDGETDEDFPEIGTQCENGVGECHRIGAFECEPETGELICNARPGRPREETCDDKDNDCDGFSDETYPTKGRRCDVGAGECARSGELVCNDDATGVECDVRAADPDIELCDQKDNDCDGNTDETFLLVGNACFVGEGGCRRDGDWVCAEDQTSVSCDAVVGPPRPEDCDGVDNDCDGETDEDLIRDCSTICGRGVEVCIRQIERFDWTGCTAPIPEDEICDEIDNDCDGETDEDFPQLLTICEVGIGQCHSVGYRVCAADGVNLRCTAVAGLPQGNESCNDGVDNDCDGETDEANCSG